MTKIKRFFHTSFKGIIALLALANLVYLFVFNYRLPGFAAALLPSASPAAAPTVPVPAETEKSSAVRALQINVPESPLYYDGSQSLDLVSGVTVTAASGAELGLSDLFTTVKTGSSPYEKVIEYSYRDASGNRASAQRILTLPITYGGPRITFSDAPLPDLSEDDLDDIAELLADEEILQADDGFGQDITSSVTADAGSVDAAGECTVTFSVTNMLNDSCSAKMTVQLSDALPTSGPVLTLSTDEITINVGDSFQFFDYIERAEDEDGTSLYQNISVNGSVDTSTAGTYQLEIYCMNSAGEISPTRTLTVHVE